MLPVGGCLASVFRHGFGRVGCLRLLAGSRRPRGLKRTSLTWTWRTC